MAKTKTPKAGERYLTPKGTLIQVHRQRKDGSFVVYVNDKPYRMTVEQFAKCTKIVRKTTRRSFEQIKADRAAIVAALTDRWVRPEPSWSAIDLVALAKDGVIEAEVREEFDKQKGNHAHAFFGGAGMVKRHRRYVRLAQTTA